MSGGWSSTIDPIQLADKGTRLSGGLPLKGMSRLAGMCRDGDGSARFDLQFERTAGDGLRVMHGTISAHVHLICQRCMRGMTVELACTPRLLLLRPGERDDLLDDGNALLVERPVMLGSLVEDELLLEMPMVPMHPIDQCPAKDAVRTVGREAPGEKENKRTNPFSALKDLKRPGH